VLKPAKVADGIRQRAQPVAVEVKHLNLAELADRLRQRAQFEVAQIQHPRTAFGQVDAEQDLFFFRHGVARGLFKRPFSAYETQCRDYRRAAAVSIFKCLSLARCRYAERPFC
jgi:hypothetical protein